uniref:Poly(A)-specific ribonuclease PARN n=1 Tax=Cacopsylla melanoneura TaxID=428564 RepID=A0A8D9BWS0_9HEMI
MCEINCHNFIEKLDTIKHSIEDAKFIAIDCEFTGLLENPLYKNSLFDSADERYEKLKEATQGFIIIQFGVTTFKYDVQLNTYQTSVYNFQLCPKWFSSDDKILFQPSCLLFLCAQKFDFNEFIYNGISYLNQSDQSIVKRDLDNDTWFNQLEQPFLNEDKAQIQDVCSQITRWIQKCGEGDSLVISVEWVDDKYIMNYVLLYEVTDRFLSKGVCSYFKPNEIHLEKFNPNDSTLKQSRETIQSQLLETAKSQAWQSMLGFSQVFNLLVEAKKPLIGHNLFTDLLFMYKQFYQPLPANLKRFKSEMRRLFPSVYDTKYISYEINSMLSDKSQRWTSNGLISLYEWLRDHKHITHLLLYMPQLKLMDDLSVSNAKLHTGGWDSFYAGFCFVHLIYMLASLKHALPTIVKPFTLTNQLACVRRLENKINLIRAEVNHLNLAGPEPESRRPDMILVQTRSGRRIRVDQVAEMFAEFGSVDVRYRSQNSALVAVGNHICARISLEKLRNHPVYKVSTFHSRKEFIVNAVIKLGLLSSLLGGITLTYLIIVKPKL